jgi:hypothetical protein
MSVPALFCLHPIAADVAERKEGNTGTKAGTKARAIICLTVS